MTKHTPGPWVVQQGEAGHWEVLQADKALCIASSCGTGNEALANARLIAAAPELLEALGRIERFLLRCESNGGSTEGQNESLSDQITLARAVIAKVTGGDE